MEDGIQELLDNLIWLIGNRKSPSVICIVHSEAGLKLVFNTNDLVVKLGMLDVAKMTLVETQAQYNQMHEDEARRAGESAVAVLVGKREPVN